MTCVSFFTQQGIYVRNMVRRSALIACKGTRRVHKKQDTIQIPILYDHANHSAAAVAAFQAVGRDATIDIFDQVTASEV